jgi:serine/threonine protein kinase
LKPSNIFLFKDGQVKIGDLNASKEQNDEGVFYSACDTYFYCCAEEFKENNYDEKIDIWAAGCVLF